MIEHIYNRYKYQFYEDASTEKELFKIISEKHSSIPDSFYKYYGINYFTVDSLINHYLYASHPWEFNDPFDCNRNLISLENASLDDILDLNNGIYPQDEINRYYKSNDPNDKKMLEDIYSKLLFFILYMRIGLFSLTTKNDSMEMWAYYAQHKGFALKFNLNYLPQNFMGPFPINYSDKFEKLEYTKFKKSSLIYQSNIKAKCWEDESEWRLLFYDQEKKLKVPFIDTPNAHNRKFYYNLIALTEVILGFKFFDLNEYDYTKSTAQDQIVKLRTNVKYKRKILRYILSQDYKIFMINYKKESSSDLVNKPITIEMISTNKYRIKYVG
jgi:hypothetical protein